MNASLSPVNVNHWLKFASSALAIKDIATARLDALVLLEDALDKDRSWLLAHPECTIPSSTVSKLEKQLQRRMNHEPLAYIRGKSEFYGREFRVNPHTLEPRSETETMIELLQELVNGKKLKVKSRKKPSENQHPKTGQRLHGSDAMQGEVEQQTESYQAYDEGAAKASTQQRAERTVSASSFADWQDSSAMTIVDVGTGSGCIAITAKCLLPETDVIATDIDKKCLDTAKQNAKQHGAQISLYEGNLLEPLSDIKHQVSGIILLANLPYVPEHFKINSAAQHEPKHAIFGGTDGLHYYRELFKQINKLPTKPQLVFTEALPPQHNELQAIATIASYDLLEQQDFIQVFVSKK
jgi:release factor glutamine methyltransferase